MDSRFWTQGSRGGMGVCGDVYMLSSEAESRGGDETPSPPTLLDSGNRGQMGKGTKDLWKLVLGGQGSSSPSCLIPRFSLELAALISYC